jgi:hypothetical protein
MTVPVLFELSFPIFLGWYIGLQSKSPWINIRDNLTQPVLFRSIQLDLFGINTIPGD